MSGQYDFFGVSTTATDNPYERIGFSRNPFRPVNAEGSARPPFYKAHLVTQLNDIQRWIQDVHDERNMWPFALVGSVGTGKTTILRTLELGLQSWPASKRVAVQTVLLTDTGFTRLSVGAMLVHGLEKAMDHLSAVGDQRPEDVLPIVWGTICAPRFPEQASGPLGNALKKARALDGDARVALARDISNWIRRLPMTPARMRESGLARTIDWEGELVGVVAEMLRFAYRAEVITTFFVFIDQIEELFGSTISDLRRSRILTDLRTLVDEIEVGAPIGLLLSWTPESDEKLSKKYEALASRLRRRQVDLPKLSRGDASPFAQVWIDALGDSSNHRNRPSAESIATRAWSELHRQRGLFDGGEKATPRDWLTALGNEVDRLAGIRETQAG
jgi:hypothetical protein